MLVPAISRLQKWGTFFVCKGHLIWLETLLRLFVISLGLSSKEGLCFICWALDNLNFGRLG